MTSLDLYPLISFLFSHWPQDNEGDWNLVMVVAVAAAAILLIPSFTRALAWSLDRKWPHHPLCPWYTTLSPWPHLTTNGNRKPSLTWVIWEHSYTWLPNLMLFDVCCDADCLPSQLLCSAFVDNRICFDQ